MKKLKDAVNKLINKVETDTANYERIAEKKTEELIISKLELQEAEAKLKDFHKLKFLDQITEESYKEQKAGVDVLNEKVNEIEHELLVIEKYKLEDAEQFFAEINAVKPNYTKEQNIEISKLQYQLQQAKLQYLENLIKAREEYIKVTNTDSKLQNLLFNHGKSSRAFISNAYNVIGSATYETHYGIRTSVMVSEEDVRNALENGKLPRDTVQAINMGKERGYIN